MRLLVTVNPSLVTPAFINTIRERMENLQKQNNMARMAAASFCSNHGYKNRHRKKSYYKIKQQA